MGELVTSFNEMAGERQRLSETFKDFPEDPARAGEFYKLPEAMLPEGVKLPDGKEFEIDAELLQQALPVFHKHRVSPEAFHDLVRAFNAHEVESYQKATAELAENRKRLGANGPTRSKAVNDGLAALVPEHAKLVDANQITSEAVELFEAVLKKFSTQNNVVPLDARRDDPPPANTKDPWGSWSQSQQKAS